MTLPTHPAPDHAPGSPSASNTPSATPDGEPSQALARWVALNLQLHRLQAQGQHESQLLDTRPSSHGKTAGDGTGAMDGRVMAFEPDEVTASTTPLSNHEWRARMRTLMRRAHEQRRCLALDGPLALPITPAEPTGPGSSPT